MEMASMKATLVDIRDFPDGVTATIPREEFEAALSLEEPAELFLEVRQPEDGATGDVSVAWSRADLERLLAETTGPAITLAFDRNELERVLVEPEIEGHGLREKALVLTVAAAAATAGASTAAAAYDELGSTARGITPSYVAVHDEATLADRGIEATAIAAHDEATLAARGITPAPVSATHDEATLASRGIEPGTLPAVHDEATLASRGIEPGTLPAVHDEATLASRGIEPATPADDAGFAIDMPSVDASTAATVAGGLAGVGLLITAAGFAVRRQRGAHPA